MNTENEGEPKFSMERLTEEQRLGVAMVLGHCYTGREVEVEVCADETVAVWIGLRPRCRLLLTDSQVLYLLREAGLQMEERYIEIDELLKEVS